MYKRTTSKIQKQKRELVIKGHIFSRYTKKMDRALDDIAKSYSKQEWDQAVTLWNERVGASKWMLSLLNNGKFKDKVLIDIGAGCGTLLFQAAQNGCQSVIGIEPFPFNSDRNDLFPFLANASRQLFRDKFNEIRHHDFMMIDSYVEEVNNLDGIADIVSLFDVMEHVPDPTLVIKKAFDFLKEGGILIISTSPYFFSTQGHHLFDEYPNLEYSWPHLRIQEQDFLKDVLRWRQSGYTSLSRITHSQLIGVLSNFDFEVIEERIFKDRGSNEVQSQIKDFIHLAPNVEDYEINMGQLILRKKSPAAEKTFKKKWFKI